jgi:predicted esterase
VQLAASVLCCAGLIYHVPTLIAAYQNPHWVLRKRPSLVQPVAPALQQMPVFLGHGGDDPIVDVQLARNTANKLKSAASRFLHPLPDAL